MKVGRHIKKIALGVAPIIDILMLALSVILAPFAWLLAQFNDRIPLTRAVFDKFNISVLRRHYYSPVVFPSDIRTPLHHTRALPGIDFKEASQLALIEKFSYASELLVIPLTAKKAGQYGYENGSYLYGDGELLYSMIRHFKPARIFEVGSGHSTLMARLAIQQNLLEDLKYTCNHVCIEPFENPWLEAAGVRVIRSRVEDCSIDFFQQLQKDDILFIDSTHVIRPQGDVLFEYLQLLPTIRPGVLIHVHDIFTPRDYPEEWIFGTRRLWNEQYLLEAFLSCNSDFEIVAALNWLHNTHRDKLSQAFPVLQKFPDTQPGAFWFRRN